MRNEQTCQMRLHSVLRLSEVSSEDFHPENVFLEGVFVNIDPLLFHDRVADLGLDILALRGRVTGSTAVHEIVLAFDIIAEDRRMTQQGLAFTFSCKNFPFDFDKEIRDGNVVLDLLDVKLR